MSDSSSFIASTGDESSSRHSLKSAGKPASGAVRADPQQVHSGEAEDEGRATPKVTHILAFPLRFVSSLSIRVTLALGFSLAAIVLVGLVGLYIFEQGRAAAQEELHGKLAAVAASVAVSVDAEAHQRIQALPDESSPDYVQLKSYLQAIRAANPDIRHVYTMVPSSDPNIWRFLVDAESNPETTSHVGEYDVSRSPEIPAALHGPVADQAITTDKWGQWLSGYAPIRNRDGQAIGIVGVDMSAETVTAKETGLRNSLIFSLLAAAAVAAALGTLLAHYFARPIRALAKVTERVAQGDLQVSAETRRRDELGDLAHRFNHMVQRLRESQESLLELANTDALTDLVNHRHGQELLARELVRALRSKHPLGVVMLDVDNFKLFNDSYGHLHGDQVLKSVAALLTRATRSTDIVARYGGDEFILVLPETDSSGVDKTIKRISAEMASLSYSDADKECQIPITFSIGSALYPFDSSVQSELLNLADAAMYEVKRRGGNGYQAADVASAVVLAARNAAFGVLDGLVEAVDTKDHYTKQHSDTVTKLSMAIAARMRLPAEIREEVRVASLLHDVGKIGIPNRILRKPASLTELEYDAMKQHSVIGAMIIQGARIIQKVPHLSDVVVAIRHHHERYDGNGYPRGLQGTEIPLISRIMAVADAYSAMTAERPHRKAMSHQAAVEELKRSAGLQFDPVVVKAFLKVVEAAGSVESKSGTSNLAVK